MLVSASFFTFGAMKLFFQKSIVTFLLLFCSYIVHAEKVYDFNATCQQAYNAITSLKINQGQQLINQAKLQNPDNLIPDFLESYIDFFVLFFNEDPAEFKIRKPHFGEHLDRLYEGQDNSPFYNYCRTIVYLQRACVEIKFGEHWGAGWDFRKAFNLAKQNRKAFPDFSPNNMIYGPMLVVASTVPDGYKWLAGLFGVKGSIKTGMQIMEGFVNGNDTWQKLFANEAGFYYCYILFYIDNKPTEALQYISQKKLDVVNNHLLAYMAANLGVNNKQTEFAKNIILRKNPSPDYMNTPVWDFEMAYIKIHHLEIEEAAKYFQSFANNFKGKFYLKDTYEKLSWCYYLLGNMKAAEQARQQVLHNGNTETDADKQADKTARSGIWPNVLLLKARLLSDGGYNVEALALLVGKSANDFTKPEERLEFAYRVARIYDDMNRDDEAIKSYLLAISLGQNRQEYYAARASLQIAYIYEQQGKKDLAIEYYQKCLDMEDHEYKDSIDQKAKAGMARCKGN